MTRDGVVRVLGIGNPLVRDEGIGPRVIEELTNRFEFPEKVEVMDLGTMGMSILGLITSAEYLIVVDAVDGTGKKPGTVVLMTPDEVAPNQVMHSLHDLRFVDVLEAAMLTGNRPEADIVGIQVKEMVSMQLGLTPEVEEAIPIAMRAVLSLLEKRGVHVSPAKAATPDDFKALQDLRGGVE